MEDGDWERILAALKTDNEEGIDICPPVTKVQSFFYPELFKINVWTKCDEVDGKKSYYRKKLLRLGFEDGVDRLEYQEEPIEEPNADPFTKMTVVRHEIRAKDWVLFYDVVQFSEGDPHCTFAVEKRGKSIQLPPGLKKVIDKLPFPVRSKIFEYLYRHERELYDELLATPTPESTVTFIIPSRFYRNSILQSQLHEVSQRDNANEVFDTIEKLLRENPDIQRLDLLMALRKSRTSSPLGSSVGEPPETRATDKPASIFDRLEDWMPDPSARQRRNFSERMEKVLERFPGLKSRVQTLPEDYI